MDNLKLEQVYIAYYRDVYLYALSLCKNHQEAEALTSDTFFKALLSLDDEAPSVKYWLLRVCRNLYLDEWRKRKRRKEEPLEPWGKEKEEGSNSSDLLRFGKTGEDVLSKMIREEEIRCLYQSMLHLPEGYREILYMFYFLEMPVQEIAGISGKTPGAVKTVLSRARGMLRRMMKEEEEG